MENLLPISDETHVDGTECSEVELQPLAYGLPHGAVPEVEIYRMKASGFERLENPHDGSFRRQRYLLGACFLVAMVCSSIVYGNLKESRRSPMQAPTKGTPPNIGASHETLASSYQDNTTGLSVDDIKNERTAQLVIDNVGGQHAFQVTPTALRQIQNFRKGNGLLLNIHITHHAGTTICGALGRALGQKGAPEKSCNGVSEEGNATIREYIETTGRPWSSNDTGTNIAIFSQFYHMISWEFRRPRKIPLKETYWEHPQLVSMIVMREPLSRLLAGDHDTAVHFPHILLGNASREEWWDFARSVNTDNFAMRVLAGRACCQGQDTSSIHLVHAKELVRRFSFVLDIACLSEGITAVAHSLGFEPKNHRSLRRLIDGMSGTEGRHLPTTMTHLPPSERIPFGDVYEFLRHRNKYDIELYEWSKEISLVHCQ